MTDWITVPPGAELDTVVAKHVMGLDVPGFTECFPYSDGSWRVCNEYVPEEAEFRPIFLKECVCDSRKTRYTREIFDHIHACYDVVPEFSTSWEAAKTIIEAMANRGFWCLIRSPFFEPSDDWYVGFTPHGVTGWNLKSDFAAQANTVAHADAMPLALCQAALAAVTDGEGDG